MSSDSINLNSSSVISPLSRILRNITICSLSFSPFIVALFLIELLFLNFSKLKPFSSFDAIARYKMRALRFNTAPLKIIKKLEIIKSPLNDLDL